MPRSEDKIIEEIVNHIDKILDQTSQNDHSDGFVGISRVEKAQSLLSTESSERVRSIGIWGMGGIGKTTIAKLLFSRLSNQFDDACFVPNVRAKVDMHGLDFVQREMILQLIGIQNVHGGPFLPMIQRRLKRKKLLIILDDVGSAQQLNALLGREDFYGQGTRIIVTSRDKQVLKNGCTHVYEVEKLNLREALMLFKIHAFKKDQPAISFIVLSKEAILYAKGLPLALEVLGCNLYGRDIEEWEMELRKLKEIPNVEVTDILKISYNGLDEKERNLFLDIACIFQGRMTNHIESILDGCGYHAGIGLSRLMDKALLSSSNGPFWMHDLLQQMGQNMVFLECMDDPGKRSRLWKIKDVYDVLTSNMGTEKVEAMTLDLSQVTDMHLQPTIFDKMLKLRVLHFRASGDKDMRIHLPDGIGFLSNELRYLHWDNYPLKSLPSKFHPEHLVNIFMRGSHVTKLWRGETELQPYLPNLKCMDLCYSRDLTILPNFSKTPKLERIVVSHCGSLVEIPDSIQNLTKLKQLIVEFCRNLCTYPNCSHLTALEVLNLQGCQKITTIPVIPQNITSLNLNNLGIRELPVSIGCHNRLQILSLDYCGQLESLPDSIGRLSRLEWLSLNGCVKLESLPDSLGNLQSLKHLGIEATSIKSLPESLKNLKSLLVLQAGYCWYLNELPQNFGSIDQLRDHPATKIVSSDTNLYAQYLEYTFTGYRGNWVPSFTCLSHFSNIGIIPEHLVGLMSLVVLDLRGSIMKSLPASIKQLPKLVELYLKDCENLVFIPELPPSVELIDAVNCSSLRYMEGLSKDKPKAPLRLEFHFGNCFNLDRSPRSRVVMDSWLRIENMASSQFVQKSKLEDFGTARLCVPGSRVPEWFQYSETESYIRVKPFRGMLNLRELAFCVVVVAPNYGPEDFNIECSCLFITDSGMIHSVKRWQEDVFLYKTFPTLEKGSDSYHALKSKHVFIGCDVRECAASTCNFVDAEFIFYAVDCRRRMLEDCEVIECGVTPIEIKGKAKRMENLGDQQDVGSSKKHVSSGKKSKGRAKKGGRRQ